MNMSKLTHAISRLDNQVVRPQMLDYVNPSAELKRLEAQGVVYHIAHGNYALIPEKSRKRNSKWLPTLEAAALGISISAYGKKNVALIGPTALRALELYPRPLGIAFVAVPTQRPEIETKIGTIHFIKRDVTQLDLVLIKTELCTGYATTFEETLIDLTRPKPDWKISSSTRKEMIGTLKNLVKDYDKLLDLAVKRRGMNALLNSVDISKKFTKKEKLVG
jgi:hypothetical protein